MISAVPSSEGKAVIEAKNVNEYEPILAIKEGKVVGMLVKEVEGWILRTGGRCGSTGHFEDLSDCIESGEECGYTFHQDVEVKDAK